MTLTRADSEIVNPYQGIYSVGNQRHYIASIYVRTTIYFGQDCQTFILNMDNHCILGSTWTPSVILGE
jgi:hypothetical protein